MYTRFRQASLLLVMRDNIVLKKTKVYHNWLKQVPDRCNIYKLYTNNKDKIRRGKEGRSNVLMLGGGPKLVEGQLLPDNEDYKIVQISYLQGNYYIVLKEVTNGESNISSNQSAETL